MNSDPMRFAKRFGRGAAVCLSLFVAGCLSGCGRAVEDEPVRAAVMGTVTLDGDLLHRGVIRFVPSDGTHGPQATATIDDGIFTLPAEFGPVVGTHRVEIQSTDDGGFAWDDENALERLQAAPTKQHIEIVRVPEIYNRHSRLTARIPEAGTGDLNFELVSRQK